MVRYSYYGTFFSRHQIAAGFRASEATCSVIMRDFRPVGIWIVCFRVPRKVSAQAGNKAQGSMSDQLARAEAENLRLVEEVRLLLRHVSESQAEVCRLLKALEEETERARGYQEEAKESAKEAARWKKKYEVSQEHV